MTTAANTLQDARTLEAGASGDAVGDADPGRCVRGFCLDVVEGPDVGASWESEGARCTIGACGACDLVLHDDTVSRFHCEVTIGPGGSRIRDLGSVNGIFVDGVRAVDAFLRSGSLVRLGCSVLRFQYAGRRVPVERSRRTRFGLMVGRSSATQNVFALLERVATNDLPVLLEGETGTGKSLAAESIHTESGRKDAPFFLVDCSAIPANLLESELFGHVKGAFSDAVDRTGAFEAASGGTLFLDEIGELPLPLQSKLLTVLDKGCFRRVGSNQMRKADVRLIVATNRDLRAEVNAGRFREDLYFRIAVLPIRIPALRERLDDMADLARSLLARSRLAPTDARIDALLSENFVASLCMHAWPGNIRELGNYLERCLAFDLSTSRDAAQVAHGADGADDDADDDADGIAGTDPTAEVALDAATPDGAVDGRSVTIAFELPYREAKKRVQDAFERRYIAELLRRHDGNVVRAAAAAGIGREYCHRLIKAHGIEKQGGS
jgi:two-component system, NtrC family, response regulator GlrR